MTGGETDHLREQVEAWIGRPMSVYITVIKLGEVMLVKL